MFESSEDFNIDNDITPDDQLLADDKKNLSVSVIAIPRTPPSIETNQQIDTKCYPKSKERYFLICDSCFWCASSFQNELTDTKCPSCHKGKIDCMPIGEDENYCFDYSIIEVLN